MFVRSGAEKALLEYGDQSYAQVQQNDMLWAVCVRMQVLVRGGQRRREQHVQAIF